MPLPIQFAPLLEDILEKVKQVVHWVLSVEKLSAELEDQGGEENALEKEMSLKVCLVIYTIRSLAYFTILSPISHVNTTCISPTIIIHG